MSEGGVPEANVSDNTYFDSGDFIHHEMSACITAPAVTAYEMHESRSKPNICIKLLLSVSILLSGYFTFQLQNKIESLYFLNLFKFASTNGARKSLFPSFKYSDTFSVKTD